MKKVITLLSLSLVVAFTSCKNGGNAVAKIKAENLIKAKERDAGIAAGAPEIEFNKTVHDFGKVTEGDIVETSFLLKNTGKVNLVVTDAKTTCGCTVPVWPKEPVKPGESAEIKVKFNTSGKPNQQSKQVTLYTNTAKGREIVTIKGFVNKKNK
mgnify:CR=1 FL=1